jgi:hypothetical protein
VIQLRKFLAWFSEVSKTYKEFHPKFSCPYSKPYEQLQRALDRKFSNILQQLAEQVETDPAALASLIRLPVTFPHHIVSYSFLQCQLLDAHERFAFAYVAEKARDDEIELKKRFPSPNVIKNWPDFASVLQLQNKLLRNLGIARNGTLALCSRLDESCAEFSAVRVATHETAQAVASQWSDSLRGIEDLTDLSAEVKRLRKLQAFTSRASSLWRDLRREEDGAQPDIRKIKDLLIRIKQSLQREVSSANRYLTNGIPRAPVDRRFQLVSRQIAEQTQRISEVFGGLSCLDSSIQGLKSVGRFADRDTVIFETVIGPSLHNMDEMISCLREKICEKVRQAGEILKRITEMRIETDRAAAVEEVVRVSLTREEEGCPMCAEGRSFVMLRCGHSFCERCFGAVVEARRCSYPGCNTILAMDEVCRVNLG